MAPWTLFHIVIYSFSDSSNKGGYVLLCKLIRGPDSCQYLSLLIWRICKQFLNYLSNRFQQIIRWHWKSLLTLGVLYRLSEKHSPLLHIASSCELQIIYRCKRTRTFRFGFLISRIIKVEVSAFNSRILVSNAPNITLSWGRVKPRLSPATNSKRSNRLDVQQKNMGL